MTIATAEDAAAAAELLVAAWHDPAKKLANLPPALRPTDLAQVDAIQQAVAARMGGIGGWKVGAPGPDATPACAPMWLSGIHVSPAHLPAARWSMRTVEAEISVRLGSSLPAYAAPYTAEQVKAAIDSCHPAIEVLDSRFTDPEALDDLTRLADSASHGCFVHGAAFEAWRSADFASERVRLVAGERELASGTGNPGGDMIRLLLWLANAGAHWAGGLEVGQFVTTGSWTGKTVVPAATPVRVVFAHAGEATVEFR